MDILKEFGRLGKQVTNVARSVSEKSKDSAEVTRLNAELKAACDALDDLYLRYGKVCYDIGAGADVGDEAEALVVRIRATLLQVAELTAQRDAAQEVRRCPGCGMAHPAEARYCSACGRKLPEDAPKPEPVEVGEYCPACGAAREGGETVCPVCGSAFEPVAVVEPVPEPEPLPATSDLEEPEDMIE